MLISSAIPFFGKQSGTVLPSNWKLIRMMNRYVPFLSKSFIKKLANQVRDNLEKTIEKIWQGDKDNVWTVNISTFLKNAYASSELHIMKDQGHFLYLTYWEAILEKAVADWGTNQ